MTKSGRPKKSSLVQISSRNLTAAQESENKKTNASAVLWAAVLVVGLIILLGFIVELIRKKFYEEETSEGCIPYSICDDCLNRKDEQQHEVEALEERVNSKPIRYSQAPQPGTHRESSNENGLNQNHNE